jgi:flagellar motor switch protein FliG
VSDIETTEESEELVTERAVGAVVEDFEVKTPMSLSNRQKVAALLAHLGAKKAAPILKELSDDEAIDFSKEMIDLPALDSVTLLQVLAEFMERIGRPDVGGAGGLELARTFLQERLGQSRAQEVLDQIEGQRAASPLIGLSHVDPQQALAVLGGQQPQVVAVLLAYLPPEDAANLLAVLEPDFRVKVAKRIAQLTRVDPVAIRQATSMLVERLRDTEGGSATTMAGGTTTMAEILNHSERAIEQQVLGALEIDDEALVQQIRAKLFTFDDVLNLDDKALQQIFRKSDAPTLALAMKDPHLAADQLAKIRANLSERVIAMIDEEIEVMGAVRSSQINVAQGTIVRIARQLDEEGVIMIAREDEVVS